MIESPVYAPSMPCPANSADQRGKQGAAAGLVGLVCNIALFGLKLALGIGSGSVAILSDAFNNLVDAVSALAMYASFTMAGRKPDEAHPCGHGRIEYIAGMVVSLLVIATGFGMAKAALVRLWYGGVVEYSDLLLPGLVFSIAVKLAMALYYRSVDAKVDSPIMRANIADSVSDGATTFAALAAVVAGQYTAFPVDGCIGLLMAVMIIRAGVQGVRETFYPLLGTVPDPELADSLTRIVLAVPDIQGVHSLVINDYGPTCKIATAHVDIPAHTPFTDAAARASQAMELVQRQLGIELTLHIDPVAE